MTPRGTITRKDIVTDEALQFGGLLVAEYEKVIKVQKELVDVTLQYAKANTTIRKVENQQEFIEEKQKIILLDQQALAVIKQTQALEISSQKIKQELIKTLEAERKAKQAVTDAENKNQKSKQSSVKLTIEERVQNEVNNRQLKQEALERLGLVSIYTKLNKSRTDAKNTLRDLIASETASTKEIDKAKKAFEELDKKVKKADAAVGDFSKNVGNYPFKNITSGIQNLIGAFGVTGGIAAFAGILKGAYETTKQFEQGVADLSAITGASGKDLEFLKNSAINLGKETKGGAVAVVEAYKLIASAKPELLDNVQALNQVTDAVITLSKASGLELPEAATNLTDAMNQFGVDASQATVFVDALAAGAKYGASEIPQTTEALLKFGAVARTSNIDINQSVGLIQLLAENGIKGAEAGTKLRNVLLKISAPDALPKEGFAALSKALKESGVSMEFLKDKTVPIEDKLKVLKPLLKDNANIVKIFGDENATAAINIIEHNDRLRELTNSAREQGVADDQAAIRMDTVNGKTELLVSTYDSLILSIGKGSGVVSNFFKFFIDGAKGSLDYLIRLNTAQDELNKKANQEGLKDGVKLFNSQLNSRKPLEAGVKDFIQSQIDELTKEYEKGNRDPKLFAEKNRLSALIQNNSQEQILRDIKDNARNQYQTLEKELIKLEKEKKFALKNPFSLENKGTNFYDGEIERVNKELGRYQAVIQQAGLNQDANKNPKKEKENKNNSDPEIDQKAIDKANKEALVKQKKFIDDYLKALKKKNDDEFELNEFRLNRAIYYNELVLNDDKKSVDERIDAYLNIEDLRKQIADGVLEKELQNIALSDDALKNKSKKEIDFYIEKSNAEITEILRTGKLKENASKDEILAYEKYILEIKKLDDKATDDKQKLIDKGANDIIKNVEKEVLEIDTLQKLKLSSENDLYQQELELANGNNEKIAKAKEDHEKRLLDIKKKYALEGLQIEIDTLQNLVDSNDKEVESKRISADEIAKIKNKLAGYILEKSDLERENYVKNTEKKEDVEKEFSSRVKELEKGLANDLSNFANQLLSNKIANIQTEISENDAYYTKQIELAGNDSRKKDALQKEQEKKRQELEKKRKKAEYDQAVFSKIITIATIASQTAMASIAALAPPPIGLGPLLGGSLLPFIIGAGAIQVATVLATPLPKYKRGRLDGPGENAIVGDGGVNEIIQRKSGLVEMTPRTDTLVRLFEGDRVHSSVDDYENYIRKSMFNNIDFQNNKMKQFQANTFINFNNDKLIEEMRMTRKAVEKSKTNVILNTEKIDINHQLWKMRNTNWN